MFHKSDRICIYLNNGAVPGFQPRRAVRHHLLVRHRIVSEIVALSLMDISVMYVSAAQFFLIFIQQPAIPGSNDIPLIGSVILAYLKLQRHIIQVPQRQAIWMSRRHIGCRKPIRHFGYNGINPVSSRRKPRQIDPVGIHIIKSDHILYEPVVERIGFRIKMAVPGIPYTSRVHINSVFNTILIV